MKKRLTAIVILLICCVCVLIACPKAATAQELTFTLPQTLTAVVGTSTKDIAGVKVAVKYSDGSVRDEVSLNSDKVTVLPATLDGVGTTTVSVSYQGFTDVFDVVVTEEDYLITKKAPNSVKYRTNATKEDVDVAGITFDLYLSGAFMLTLDSADPAVKNRIKAVSIDTTNRVVVYQYDLSHFEDEYVGKAARGSFSIQTVSAWTTSIMVSSLPDIDSYPVKQDSENNIKLDKNDINLAGGSVALSDNLGTPVYLTLPHENISVAEFKLHPLDYKKGVVTIQYKDDILTCESIACDFEVNITGHNLGTEFAYYASLLPPPLSLDFSNMPSLTPLHNARQKEAAGLAISLYKSNDFSSLRSMYSSQLHTVLVSAVYLSVASLSEGSKEVDARLKLLLSGSFDKNAASAAAAYADELSKAYLDAISLLDSSLIGGIVVYDDVLVEEIVAYISGQMKENLAPIVTAIPAAIDIFEKLSVIPDSAWTLDLSNYAATIEWVYNKFIQVYNADSTGIAAYTACKLAVAWRWDIVDILYDYYYVGGNEFTSTVNVQIYNLINIGVMPSALAEVVAVIEEVMLYMTVREHVIFTYKYQGYAVLINRLDNYQYTALPIVFNQLRITVWFNPADFGTTINGSSAAAQYNLSVPYIMSAISAWYNFHYEIIGEVYKGQEFINFVAAYAQVLLKWLPVTHWDNLNFPEGSSDFDSDFEAVAQLFGTLSHEAKIGLINHLDISPLIDVSVFTLMSDAYFKTRLSDSEFGLYYEMIDAYIMLGALFDRGFSSDFVKNYLAKMSVLNVYYSSIGKLNDDFLKYFGDMLQFCIESHDVMKSIPQAFYATMDDIDRANAFYYAEDIENFKKTVEAMDRYLNNIFSVSTTLSWDTMKEIVFNGHSLFDQYASVKSLYDALG